jgi:hypothetical protein
VDITSLTSASFLLTRARILHDFTQDCVYYLATPYSNYPGGVGAGLRLATWATAGLAHGGYTSVSPILQFHGAQQLFPRLSGEWEHWADHNHRLISALPALIFLDIGTPTYYSIGMAHEYQAFKRLGKPIFVWLPGEKGDCPVISLAPSDYDPWSQLPPEPTLDSGKTALEQLANDLKKGLQK